MYVGLLTAPFGDQPLDNVAAFAAEYGFGGLEIIAGPGSKHVDVSVLSIEEIARIRELMEKRSLNISALSCFFNTTEDDAEKRKAGTELLKKATDAAVALGSDVVNVLAGFAVPGKSKMQTIEEYAPDVFIPALEYAAGKGVKFACENYYATNIQHLAHWQRLFEVVPNANFGLNFDPSHLAWQDIDYIYAVEKFADRIFHTHAKDVEVKAAKKAWVGNQNGGGWWRYVIPGLGDIRWGQYISALRSNGYNGVLSIEHEDDAVGREEGFLIGKKYLEQFMVPNA